MVGRVLTASLYLAGKCLYYVGVAPLVRWLGRNNPKILLYHDCSERQSDYLADLECTTSPENFRRHLAYLCHHYRVVPLELILSGRGPPSSVAITFDDGYASVYENSFPELKARQAPATIYLISSVVDNRALVWVNELNHLLRRCGAVGGEIARRHFDVSVEAKPIDIVNACRIQYSPAKVRDLLTDLRKCAGISEAENASAAQLYLSWRQIYEMHEAGIEFGNHSRTHPNMERLTEEEQFAEIENAQKELESHLSVVRGFAHPFGHRGPTTASIASTLGLSSAADVGGYNCPVQPLSLGRTHMANEPIAGLFSRMEVVEPIKGFIKQRFRRPNVASAAARNALHAIRSDRQTQL